MINFIQELFNHNHLTFICNVITLSFLIFMAINYIIIFLSRYPFGKDYESLLTTIFILINITYILTSWVVDVYIYKGNTFFLILIDYIISVPAFFSYCLFIPILKIKFIDWNKLIFLFMIPVYAVTIVLSLFFNSNYGVKSYIKNLYPIIVVVITIMNLLCLIIFIFSAIKFKIYKEIEKLIILISLITLEITYGLDRSLEIVFGNYHFNKNYFLVVIICFLFFIIFTLRSNKNHKEILELNQTLESKVQNRTRELESAKNKIEEQIIKMKNFFVNLSHEIKTPLTLISNYFDDYIQETGSNKSLEIVKSNIDRMKMNIINFFDFEKLMFGKSIYDNNQITDFSQLLDEKISLFIEVNKYNKDILFETEIENKLYIMIDPYALERVINNLIDNAIKYSQKGIIKVILKSKNDKVNFIVQDSGIGIPEDQLDNIFEAYYQLSIEKKNNQGIGLGLSIVKTIVESVNGEIKVQSKLNTGSCFTLIFNKCHNELDKTNKIKISKPSMLTDIKIRNDSNVYGRKNILIIEDNVDLLNYFSDFCSKEFNIFLAENGRVAIEKLKLIPTPDVIISDIMMPEIDGYELYRMMLDDKKYENIPFIFLTAKNLDSEKLDGLKMGAYDYITKPFLIDELSIKIKNIINRKKKIEEFKGDVLNKAKEFVAEKFVESLNNDSQKKMSIEEKLDKICKENRLNERDRKIIISIMNGEVYKVMADKYGMSLDGIKKVIYRKIYDRLNVHNSDDLIDYFKNL
jgi:signal transduction histidine kinase/DNA-binding response OmpR family regulator